jgi:peptidoglycan hydrolase CwlO-like protein
MIRRGLTLLLCTLTLVPVLFALASVSFSQDQTDSDKPEPAAQRQEPKADCCDELKQRMDKLEQTVTQEVAGLKADLVKLNKTVGANQKSLKTAQQQLTMLAKDVSELATSLGQTDQRLEKLARDVEASQMELQHTKRQVEKLVEDVRMNNIAINLAESKLKQISRYDDGSQRYVPEILGNMQGSRSFQDEVRRAIQGKLVIHNNHPYEQIVHINGSGWRARVGTSHVHVPLGLVGVTHLTGGQPVYRDNWSFSDKHGWVLEFDFDKPWQHGR